MMKSRTILTLLLVVAFMGVLHAQDWTHFVRTSGHGCDIDQLHEIMNDARQTHLFGIEVDNDISGRYDSFLDPEKKLRAIKAMADSAHAAGNFAFIYNAGLECITENLQPGSRSFLRDHPDWVQRNREGKPALFSNGDAFWIPENSEDVWISPYAPEWRQIYMEQIRKIAATGIDGIYIDIPYWMTHFTGWEDTWASFDKYTVDEFNRRTGIDALTAFTPGDWNGPDFIAWVDFRVNTITEFMAEIDRNAKSVNPACKIIAEIYPGIGEEAARVGADVYSLYPAVDVIAHEYNPGENSARRTPAEWMEYMIGMYTFRAFADGKPSWMLSYSWDGEDSIVPSDAIENLAMSHVMAGTNSWDARRFVMSGSNDYEARKKVYKWISDHEKLIYAPRKPISPVGIYFSPKTRNYFADEWIESYMGIFNLLLQEHIEFEIVTPCTLYTAKSSMLILPDVKCIGEDEFAGLKSWIKSGKTIIYSGETGMYNDKRVLEADKSRMQKLSESSSGVIFVPGNPEKQYYKSFKANFDNSVYSGKYPVIQNNEIEKLLELIRKAPGYKPAVIIANAEVCVTQVASVNNKPTVFIANFSGLKGRVNANQFPARNVTLTFSNAPQSAKITFVPFLGEVQQLKGKWTNGKLRVTLPVITRGCIVQLNQ